MTPRDQANAFILALEAELPGLGDRNNRKVLADLARAWSFGQFGPGTMRESVMSGASVLDYSAADGLARVERAIERVEAADLEADYQSQQAEDWAAVRAEQTESLHRARHGRHMGER